MDMVFKIAGVSFLGYILGSVNSSLVVSKFHKIDIRKHGSGNAGVTNTLRVLGKTAAILVLFGDILKGLISCVIGYYIAGEMGPIFAGISSVAGHNWPLFFKFKGGKGVLTSFAVITYVDWKIALLLLCTFIIIVAITRYVSLGSIVGGATLIVLAIAFKRDIQFIVFAVILGLLIIIKHHSNIKRLINKTESKLGEKTRDKETLVRSDNKI